MKQELIEKAWSAIDGDRLRQTLIEMVNVYSPSGKEEDIQLCIEALLENAGFEVTRQEVDEERYNLYSTMGAGEPRLFLVGHVDTVPAWDLDEYCATEEWGVVRGLGTADMKGGCAAMLEAWFALAELPEDERPSIGLLFVSVKKKTVMVARSFLRLLDLPGL